MKLRPEEITSILKDRIREFDVETDLSEVGTVLQVGSYRADGSVRGRIERLRHELATTTA